MTPLDLTSAVNKADSLLLKTAACLPLIGIAFSANNINNLVRADAAANASDAEDIDDDEIFTRLFVVIRDYRVASIIRNFICIAALATLMGLGIFNGMGPLISSGAGIGIFTIMNIHEGREIYKNNKKSNELFS